VLIPESLNVPVFVLASGTEPANAALMDTDPLLLTV
jgi:hypothetical protein